MGFSVPDIESSGSVVWSEGFRFFSCQLHLYWAKPTFVLQRLGIGSLPFLICQTPNTTTVDCRASFKVIVPWHGLATNNLLQADRFGVLPCHWKRHGIDQCRGFRDEEEYVIFALRW